MLWKEITIGFLLAGFIGQLPQQLLQRALHHRTRPPALKLLENAIVGPVIAILSFVCSVGNIPLAAVLWSGGIGFAGVIAFIFADLIVLPIIAIYRKYYGRAFATRIVALMFVTIVIAALIVSGLFSAAGLIPDVRPSRADIFSSIKVDYKLFTNILGVIVFGVLIGLTMRRGATDPVCGMRVDRATALHAEDARGNALLLRPSLRAHLPGLARGPRQWRDASPRRGRPRALRSGPGVAQLPPWCSGTSRRSCCEATSSTLRSESSSAQRSERSSRRLWRTAPNAAPMTIPTTRSTTLPAQQERLEVPEHHGGS